MTDRELSRLLDWHELSWQGYCRVRRGVKRRIRRHMMALGCRTLEAYLQALQENPREHEHCRLLLTVSISKFFRDGDVWDVLEKRVFPGIIESGVRELKVWSAGCARGEEVYSFKIVWNELKIRFGKLPGLTIWASDLNPSYLEAGGQGRYTSGSLKELPAALRNRYLRKAPEGNTYEVMEFLKKGILWKQHDLLRDDPPNAGMHIIFLRNNLLTYCRKHVIEKVLPKIVDALLPAGYLVIGAKENLPDKMKDQFVSPFPVSIFQKRGDLLPGA